MRNLSRKEIQEFIEKTIDDNPTPEMLKKLKNHAMSKNVKIGALRKRFCKKCYSLFPINSEIRIKKGIKRTVCKNCGNITRHKIKK
jgi:RNase P subunit RPR2